jgi:hypothetical protein
MKESSPKNLFILCGILLVIAIGSYAHSHSLIADKQALAKREDADLKKVKGVGQLIYNFQQETRTVNSAIDKNSRGDLSMNTILKLCNQNELKAPANSKESISVKRTYREKIVTLKLRDEMLKSCINFLLNVEELGNVKVSKLDIVRNPKNTDLWNVDVTITKRLKKDMTGS